MRFTSGAVAFIGFLATVLGFVLGLCWSSLSEASEWDAIETLAWEVCSDGPRPADCVEWMRQCMIWQMTKAEAWNFEMVGERCIELLPADLWPY